MKREEIYLKLPLLLQNVACSVEGMRVARSRRNGTFRKELAAVESREFWSVERMREFRDQRLRRFVAHAAATVPYYRTWFQGSGMSPEEIRGLDDLRLLPTLSKHEVQERGSEFCSEAVRDNQCTMAHTSGTTGGGLRFRTTAQALREQWAVYWRYRQSHGIQLDTWCAYFGGRLIVPLSQQKPPFWRYNYPGRQLLFSGYHLNEANLKHYVEKLRHAQAPWLHGYPSLLALLANYMIDRRLELGYRVRWVTVGAENLLADQADAIAKAFGFAARQHYGMSEAVANISECEQGVLHVDEDFAAVEFIPNGFGGYRIVGTNLSNMATPLLRYDVRDDVQLRAQPCSCGRPGRTVATLDGRREDYVVLANGTCLGRLDHVFKDLAHIREAQIYQIRPGAITIRVVRNQSYSVDDERALVHSAKEKVGADIQITIEYRDCLERSRTGKLRFVISEIEQARIGHHTEPWRV